MNRNCSKCNIKIDKKNYLKNRTLCRSCYNKNRRKNTIINNEISITSQQPKNDNNINKDDNTIIATHENHAYVVVGPRNNGKTYYMLKKLEKIGNKRPIHIITRSPNQYPIYKTSNENKPINKYKGSVVIFDDMLGAQNSSQIDEFFTRGKHEDLCVLYCSQSYFTLSRQTIRNNSDIILRDVQCMYYDTEAYDMKYDEFKEVCRKAWSEKFNYLCIEMTENKNECMHCIFNESKNTYIECIPETEAFKSI